MSGIDLAALTPAELAVYAAAYQDAIDDTADRRRRDAEAITDLQAQLASARADAEYWARVANPRRVPTGPSHADLADQRRQLMAAAATTTTVPWLDVPTRAPADLTATR